MKTYSYQDVQRGELTGFFGFALALLFALLLTWVSGCGDSYEPGTVLTEPVVDISCDEPVGEPRCFILVHYADDVAARYGLRDAWWDADITEERVSYLDSPPPGVLFTVTACNVVGCTEAKLFIAREA
jgi:hypothetical protein